MYYVYVLLSTTDHRLYIGYSADLKRRIAEHNRGENKSTKGRRPLKLLYYEAHTTSADAKRRERYFKTNKGKSTLKQMMRDALT